MTKHIHCLHFNLCSGCLFNEDVDQPPILDEARAYFKQKGISILPFYFDKAIHWRYRAKLVVRGDIQNPLIGLYKEGTHEVIPISSCRVHHPRINQAITVIQNIIKSEHVAPYDERTYHGVLRYLQLVVERKTGKIQLSLVINGKLGSLEHAKWIEKLWEAGKDDLWQSIWINFNTIKTNTIFGNDWQHCYGEEYLWESFKKTEVCFLPGSFAQANLDLFEKMLVRIKDLIPLSSNLVEYYAGVGVMGLFVLDKCTWIKCCEINPQAHLCFEKSKKKLSSEDAKKISFYTGKTKDYLNLLEDATIVIVDPPRKGLEPLLLKALKNSNLDKIIYVSCGWDSFQKDCEELLEVGWKLKEAEAYLFFPGSNHLEVLAVFER